MFDINKWVENLKSQYIYIRKFYVSPNSSWLKISQKKKSIFWVINLYFVSMDAKRQLSQEKGIYGSLFYVYTLFYLWLHHIYTQYIVCCKVTCSLVMSWNLNFFCSRSTSERRQKEEGCSTGKSKRWWKRRRR